jgi:hypothetical protein
MIIKSWNKFPPLEARIEALEIFELVSGVLINDWTSIFSICQTQDRLLEDDAFSSIWSEVVALK